VNITAHLKSANVHTIEEAGETTNQIPQHDPIARQEKLKQITVLGLRHMEDKKVSADVLGHQIVLQDVVSNVATVVEWAEQYVKDALKDLPYASIVVAGICLVLPLLKNPPAGETANQEGFAHVTSHMYYYVAMESLLLSKHLQPDLKADLTERLVGFYKLIIDFQLQTVLRFFRSRTKNFFRETINYDDWDKKIQNIKDIDKELVLKFEMAISATSLDALKDLAREAEASHTALVNLLRSQQELLKVNHEQLGIARDHLTFAQKMDQRISDDENRNCLQALQATDPRDDKKRIELEKGGLLRDSYCWVFKHDDFHRWHGNAENRFLWIKGDPGKGKTMLLCGIIDELIESTAHSANVAFFFCQATNDHINNTTAVLRGLIYMLIKQQPLLISHLRGSYDDFGKRRFEGGNAFVALLKIFTNILEDPSLRRTYLIIDALDECSTDQNLLLELVQNSSTYSHIKWIVSSRNWPSIEKSLRKVEKTSLCLELNESSVSAAVTTYIQFKVDRLAERNEYDDDTRDAVQCYLSSNAKDTFLWVALVCQELFNISGWEAQDMLSAFPPGLDALYRRMMLQICESNHAKLFKSILAVVSVVYRPITLEELTSLVDMPPQISGNYKALEEIIGRCGSFLTLREHTISFVHQSAKEFLVEKESEEVFQSGMQDVHSSIFSRSLKAMSGTLRRDVYRLGAPGIPISQVKAPKPDPLAKARYSCIYWVEHLYNCDPTQNAVNELRDGGDVDSFLRRSYLYWLEALSLLKSMSSGVLSIIKLDALLQVSPEIRLYSPIRPYQLF
jgi:hypothetical protein